MCIQDAAPQPFCVLCPPFTLLEGLDAILEGESVRGDADALSSSLLPLQQQCGVASLAPKFTPSYLLLLNPCPGHVLKGFAMNDSYMCSIKAGCIFPKEQCYD